MTAALVMLVLAKPAWVTNASGPLVGPTDLRRVSASRYRVKEVVRFWIDRPSRLTGLKIGLAGKPGLAKVHLWEDIDHSWPFYRFEKDHAPPIPIRIARPDLNSWKEVDLGRRSVAVRNSGYLYVGIEVTKDSPQFAVDARLDRKDDSRYEVYDRSDPRPATAHWLRARGDYAVAIQLDPLPKRPQLFEDVTHKAGPSGAKASAIAWGDVDGDGWEDLLLNGSKLFRNVKGKRFEDATAGSKLRPGASFGIFADADNDGDLDLFVGSSDWRLGDRLYFNDGRGRFPRTTDLSDDSPTKAASWFDANDDGLVDLFVANGADGKVTPNRLWLNRGRGRFAAAPPSALTTASSKEGFARSSLATDLDLDGRSELAIANFRLQPDELWWFKGGLRNRAKELKFDVSKSPSGAITGGQGTGIASGDLDGDARPDLWVANLMHPDWRGWEASNLTAVFLSKGQRFFRRSDASQLGIVFDESPADPTVGDFDNDGDLDVYTGSTYHRGDLHWNQGNARFVEGTFESGIRTRRGEASAACDFDRDGRMDVAVQTADKKILLYRNVGAHRSWLEVVLVSKRTTVGATVFVQAGGRRQIRQVIAGKGLGSQDSQVLHFGLGNTKRVDSIEVLWPGGRRSKHPASKIDRRITLRSP